MNFIVVDTSVVVKWVSQENELLVENADRLLQDLQHNQIKVISPELTKYEFGNVLVKSKKMDTVSVLAALELIYKLPLTFIAETKDSASNTLRLAQKLGLTYHDASFLSLALEYNATLVTDNIKHQGKPSGIKVIALKDYN